MAIYTRELSFDAKRSLQIRWRIGNENECEIGPSVRRVHRTNFIHANRGHSEVMGKKRLALQRHQLNFDRFM